MQRGLDIQGAVGIYCVSAMERVSMRIKQFSDIRIGHAFRERLANVPDGDVKVIQPKDIASAGFISFASDEPLRTDVCAARPLQSGEVLVVNRGRFAATVFEGLEDGAWIVPSSILVLSVKNESVLPEYVALYLNSVAGQKLFSRHYEQTTVSFISAKNLANMDMPVPTIERQRTLIAFERTAKKYARLSNRKQELHSELLNHELMDTEHSMQRRAR